MEQADRLEFRRAVVTPFAWADVLAFVERRAARGVEGVVAGRYVRTLRRGSDCGWITVGFEERDALRIEISASLVAHASELIGAVASTFDADAEIERIATALGDVAADLPGLRVPGAFDHFELIVRAVLGQQISVTAASTLAGRFAGAFGEPLLTPFADVVRLSPIAADVARASVDDLIALGITRSRSATILHLARAIADASFDPAAPEGPERGIAALVAMPGIGDWTAHYVAMRAWGWRDAFPAGDLVIKRALGVRSSRQATLAAAAWRPWRAYAAMHLWRSAAAERVEPT